MKDFKNNSIKYLSVMIILSIIIALVPVSDNNKNDMHILNGQFYSETSLYGVIYSAMEYNSDKRTYDGVIVVQNGQITNWDYIQSIADENEWIGIQAVNTQFSAANAAKRQNNTTNETKEISESTLTQNEDAKTQDLTKENENKDARKGIMPAQEEIEAAWVESNRIESTCTEAGYIEYTNSLTADTKKEDLPLLEHDYIEKSKTDATCTEDGKITYECSICGDTKEEIISATGHTIESTTTDAGLFTEGNVIEKCSVCGEVISETIIPQKCPTLLAIIVASVVAIIILVCVIAVFKRKRK